MNPIHRFLASIALAGATALPVLAEQPLAPPAEATATPAGTAAPVVPVNGREMIIPEVKFENVPVEDVINYLQDISKGYRAVIVRKGKADDAPLVTMRLKSVSVQQVLDVIVTAYGGIEITPVDGPNGAVDVVSILPRAVVDFGDVPGVNGGVGGGPPAAEPERAVRVYRLAGIVATMTQQPGSAGKEKVAMEKAALANVLSLVKATIELTAGREAPTIQLHEETLTLIFKGSPQQRLALEDVLAALESNRAVRGGDETGATPADFIRLRKQIEEARAALEQAKQEAVLLRTELNAVQRQSDTQIQDQAARFRAANDEIEKLRATMREMERVKPATK